MKVVLDVSDALEDCDTITAAAWWSCAIFTLWEWQWFWSTARIRDTENTVPTSSAHPRSGELRTQKLKSHLMRTQSLNVLPLKSGVGQYIAIHATLTARDFFLAYFYTSRPFTCIFSNTSPEFSLCWLWLAHGSCVGSQNKMGHPAGCRFPCWVAAEYK